MFATSLFRYTTDIFALNGLSISFIYCTWAQLIATCSKMVGQTSFTIPSETFSSSQKSVRTVN